jgi:hypothetical protein
MTELIARKTFEKGKNFVYSHKKRRRWSAELCLFWAAEMSLVKLLQGNNRLSV